MSVCSDHRRINKSTSLLKNRVNVMCTTKTRGIKHLNDLHFPIYLYRLLTIHRPSLPFPLIISHLSPLTSLPLLLPLPLPLILLPKPLLPLPPDHQPPNIKRIHHRHHPPPPIPPPRPFLFHPIPRQIHFVRPRQAFPIHWMKNIE